MFPLNNLARKGLIPPPTSTQPSVASVCCLSDNWPNCITCLSSDSIQIVNSLRQRLIHWGLNKMATIFQTIFLNAFSWMKSFVFWLRFHLRLLLRVKMTIRYMYHWFRNWLGAIRQEAITWTNVFQYLYCHMASLGHNELRLRSGTHITNHDFGATSRYLRHG